MPSINQRFSCCRKAAQLLVDDGLLLVITPDSKHQNRNSKMMKSWKLCLEALGLKRIKYEKQTHLHCIAFRKMSHWIQNVISDDSLTSVHHLFIPQDYQDYSKDDSLEIKGDYIKSDTDLELITNGFMELPQIFDLDD